MGWLRRRTAKPTVRGSGVASAGDAVPTSTGDEGLVEPAEAARRFWAWWAQLLPEISAALGDRTPERHAKELAEAVAAIHPDLRFSVDRGHRAVYALVVTGQEDPALRAYTDAWKAAAPPDDVVWEYHDSVPPVPDPTAVTVNLGEQRISVADIRVAAQVDEIEGVVDVAVYHPALSELDERERTAMTFLPLDATLGERVAADRLRRVETALHEPADAITLLELRDIVGRLAEMRRPTAGASTLGSTGTGPTDVGQDAAGRATTEQDGQDGAAPGQDSPR